MATVGVEFSVFSDPRYKLLGKLTRTDNFGAIGRMSGLWMYCVERNTSVLSKEIIDAMTNRKGYADAMVQSELAEPCDDNDTHVRVKGTQGRIEWLAGARERQKKASEAARLKRIEKEQESEQVPESDTDDESEVSLHEQSDLGPTSESNVGTVSDVSFQKNSSSSTSTSASSSIPTPEPSKKEIIAQGSSIPDAGQENFLPEKTLSGEKTPESLDPEGPSPTALTWRSYREAYQERHGDAPPWNAKTGGQLKSFVSRIPKEEAPLIAAFYLTHNDSFYVKQMHPVGLLLRDAEKLRTEWATGRKMTGAKAKQSEQRDSNVEAMREYLASKGMAQ